MRPHRPTGPSSHRVEVLALGDGVADTATPSPDGRWLAVSGSDTPGAPDWSWPHVYLARSDGAGHPIRLAPEVDLPHGSWLDCDLTGWTSWQRPGPFFTTDADGRADAVVGHPQRSRAEPTVAHAIRPRDRRARAGCPAGER